MCAFSLGDTSNTGVFCGFIVPVAPEGSTGMLILVVVFGEACTYCILQYMNNLFLMSDMLVFEWCVKSFNPGIWSLITRVKGR